MNKVVCVINGERDCVTIQKQMQSISAFGSWLEVNLESYPHTDNESRETFSPNLRFNCRFRSKVNAKIFQIQKCCFGEEMNFLHNGTLETLSETLKFIMYPDVTSFDKVNLSQFDWLEIEEFEMQLIGFQCIPIWIQKFTETRNKLELISSKNVSNESLETCNSIPDTINCLKKLTHILIAPIFIYLCL
ncbi:dimer_Tnp_hAT domain-containing protein [Trichonephila clavipes]|uniref:Dimer_Tnp_hAT domain-containing protein n=1 Tax=Trichonephila clavipes TaxID=2585209 RepID=A0A8X6UYT7_TRICX|nr:dimer_Tnp_hAT domain-containing protein [Trichonephila clavipes]